MKALLLTLLIFFGAGPLAAQRTEDLVLRVGQQKTAPAGKVSVKFLAVTEDSRCPTGTNCIWAGVARVKIQVRKNGRSDEFELNTNQLDQPAIFAGREIRLSSLSPHPAAGKKIGRSDYSAVFTVARQSK